MAAELKPDAGRMLYLYGVTQSRPPDPIAQTGVDLKSEVVPLDCAGVVCWTSEVSAIEFGEELAANMENLDWLANASIAHQRVVATLARQTDILPARFGTVFRTATSLRKHISGSLGEIKKDFTRVKDAEEWGVKVFAIRQATPIPQVRSGKDYLKAKASLLPARKATRPRPEEFTDLEKALAQVAEERSTLGTISSGQRGLIFQTSLLVKRKKQKQLQAVLKKFSQRWADERKIECTGPWPPYSFVSRGRERSLSR